MQTKNINENCGCGGGSVPETTINRTSIPDPDLGKIADVSDGRSGTINDSIRNSRGEVIGYVLNNERGTFRVFKQKVTKIYEGEGMASLDNVSGMGEVNPPTSTETGSGDQFPSLTVGTPASKKGKKSKKDESPISKAVMSWKDFRKNMLKSQ